MKAYLDPRSHILTLDDEGFDTCIDLAMVTALTDDDDGNLQLWIGSHAIAVKGQPRALVDAVMADWRAIRTPDGFFARRIGKKVAKKAGRVRERVSRPWRLSLSVDPMEAM